MRQVSFNVSRNLYSQRGKIQDGLTLRLGAEDKRLANSELGTVVQLILGALTFSSSAP